MSYKVTVEFVPQFMDGMNLPASARQIEVYAGVIEVPEYDEQFLTIEQDQKTTVIISTLVLKVTSEVEPVV